MRTTLTIEPDVALKIRQKMAREKVSLKRAVNDALRAGLSQPTRQHKRPRFKVEPMHLGPFAPGIDGTKLGQLLDQLEVEEYLRKESKRR